MSFGRTRNEAPFSGLEITSHLWWEGCLEGPRELDRFKVFSRKWDGREKRPASTRDVTGLLDRQPRQRVHLRTTIWRKGSRATVPRTVVDRGGRGAVWPPCPTERSELSRTTAGAPPIRQQWSYSLYRQSAPHPVVQSARRDRIGATLASPRAERRGPGALPVAHRACHRRVRLPRRPGP